jgi:hypothetical protein
MTLDTYAGLFDDDLDAVGIALHQAASVTGVGRLWAESTRTDRDDHSKKNAPPA